MYNKNCSYTIKDIFSCPLILSYWFIQKSLPLYTPVCYQIYPKTSFIFLYRLLCIPQCSFSLSPPKNICNNLSPMSLYKMYREKKGRATNIIYFLSLVAFNTQYSTTTSWICIQHVYPSCVYHIRVEYFASEFIHLQTYSWSYEFILISLISYSKDISLNIKARNLVFRDLGVRVF